jgi:hypothetical protein
VHGITVDSVTEAQKAEWLTARETAELTVEAALVHILVRSYRPPRGMQDLIAAHPGLITDPTARRAVAESAVINAEVATWAPKQSTDYLKYDLLRQHLVRIWRVDDDDDRSLTAAARDRGLGSVVEAIEAVRPFFLRQRLNAMDAAEPATGAG